MNRIHLLSAALAAAMLTLGAPAQAADDATSGSGLTKTEAKDLKAQSEGNYKARKKVAEADEALDKADCKAALDGSAKRACDKTAKYDAKSDKAAAKTVHEVEKKAIKDATAK